MHDIGKNIVGVVLGCNNYEVIDLGVMVSTEKILQTAIDENVDIIGLSGLITPSLDEMIHVASEMKRRNFEVPLLIGGATTSRAHTAIKIAPAYNKEVVHVLDASRAVGVVSALLSEEQKPDYDARNREEQESLREQYAARRVEKKMLSLAEARKRRTMLHWKAEDVSQPEFTGVRVLNNYPLEELVPYIDWTPFFHTWELHGRFPAILDDAVVGEAARKVYEEARTLLEQIVNGKLLTARAVYGLFPANSVGDDVELYTDESRSEVLTRFHFLRQQMDKEATGEEEKKRRREEEKKEDSSLIPPPSSLAPSSTLNLCLADYVAPKETGLADHFGGFAVTAGIGVDEIKARFRAEHDDYNAIMADALADRLAEAFAERLHKIVRDEWGYGRHENLSQEDIVKERYRGVRPAPGYPACPDHTEKRTLFDLMAVEDKTGICLTESFAMHPASSVSGFYIQHPASRYFPVGKIEKDQVENYAKRKGMEIMTVERWLAPNLNYDPERG